MYTIPLQVQTAMHDTNKQPGFYRTKRILTACRFRSSMNCDGAWPRLKRSWHKHHILYGLLQINNKLPHGELWSNEYCCNLRMVCHSSYCR